MEQPETESKNPASFTDLPPRLRILTLILGVSAIAAIGWACADFQPVTVSTGLVILTVMALLVIPLGVLLPTIETMVLFGDTFLMAVGIIHGPSACVASTACYGAACGLLIARLGRWWPPIFSFSSLVCGAFLYSQAYYFARPPYPSRISELAPAAAAMAVVSFVFSAALAATASRWSGAKGGWWTRFRVHLPLVPNFLLAAGGAVFIARFKDAFPAVLLLAAPLIVLERAWTQAYRNRLARRPAS